MAEEQLRSELRRIAAELGASEELPVELERPRNPEHGDLATNLALVLAGRLSRAPRELATEIQDRLDVESAGISAVEVAGPGFVNFRFSRALLQDRLADVLAADQDFGRTDVGAGTRVQVEFVSANPTGPLHVAHGRGGAIGDAIASLLEWTGHDVQREYYVNDAGVQIDRLAESIDARWHQQRGEDAALPDQGYRGEYVNDLARTIDEEQGAELERMDAVERVERFRERAVARLRAEQERDLREFGVVYDEFYPESRLYDENKIEETLTELRERDLIYDADGATWIRSGQHGDDKDRVLIKSDGSFTYFMPDLAYHREKWRRGFERVIDVWGADHHGYIPRMQAALTALGHADLLEVEVVQIVRVLRGGKEVRLSKRAGEIITLRELLEETGVDVARYFFLMRRADAQMVFDLDLALDHSEKNPVYKVQYAHARMMSIFRKAELEPKAVDAASVDLDRLRTDAELELIKQLDRFPETVERAAEVRAPHTICEYLEETAGMVNSWYHAGNPSRNPELAVLVDDDGLRRARLVLVRAVHVVLRNGLELLGIDAPNQMRRETVE